jgi:hypothetical protein
VSKLAWYHWIAGYLIIIAGITFTVIPDKPWWLWISIFVVGLIGLLMVFLPHKEDIITKEEGS